MKPNKSTIIEKFKEDCETILKHLQSYHSPHYAIAFHIGDDSTGICGKSFGGMFPEDQRAHVAEEIAHCGKSFANEQPDEKFEIPVLRIRVQSKSDIN